MGADRSTAPYRLRKRVHQLLRLLWICKHLNQKCSSPGEGLAPAGFFESHQSTTYFGGSLSSAIVALGLIRWRRPSGLASAPFSISTMTCCGVSEGSRAISLAARL